MTLLPSLAVLNPGCILETSGIFLKTKKQTNKLMPGIDQLVRHQNGGGEVGRKSFLNSTGDHNG